jgi:hypothetical protein
MSAKVGYAVNSSRHAKYHIIMIVVRVYATKIMIVYRIIVILSLVKLMLAELLGMNQEEQMENGVMMCPTGRLVNVQATFVNTGNVNHRMYLWVKCVSLMEPRILVHKRHLVPAVKQLVLPLVVGGKIIGTKNVVVKMTSLHGVLTVKTKAMEVHVEIQIIAIIVVCLAVEDCGVSTIGVWIICHLPLLQHPYIITLPILILLIVIRLIVTSLLIFVRVTHHIHGVRFLTAVEYLAIIVSPEILILAVRFFLDFVIPLLDMEQLH